MDKGSPQAGHASNEVTIVISRKVKPGYEKEYDEWLRRYLMLEKKVPGYVGATIITQGGTDSAIRHIIYRFSDKASLDAWEDSEEARKQIEEANKSSTRYYERATGLETWFALPDVKAIVAPPKWKMAIVSLLAAYCISTLSNYILGPFLGPWPLLASSIIINVILVVSLTYFAMPILSRLLQRWLYPRNV